jgi:hypothetical protein
MNQNKDYRIKTSKRTLPKMAQSLQVDASHPKPKTNLLFSEFRATHHPDSLLHTVIEEHLLKFGYLNAFDSFAQELPDKLKQRDRKEDLPPISLTDLKNTIMEVALELSRTSNAARTSSSSRTGRCCSRRWPSATPTEARTPSSNL